MNKRFIEQNNFLIYTPLKFKQTWMKATQILQPVYNIALRIGAVSCIT